MLIVSPVSIPDILYRYFHSLISNLTSSIRDDSKGRGRDFSVSVLATRISSDIRSGIASGIGEPEAPRIKRILPNGNFRVVGVAVIKDFAPEEDGPSSSGLRLS